MIKKFIIISTCLISLLLNIIFAWILYKDYSYVENAKVSYESSIIALKQAEQYLSKSLYSSGPKRTQLLFLGYNMVLVSENKVHEYEAYFQRKRIDVDNLSRQTSVIKEELVHEISNGIMYEFSSTSNTERVIDKLKNIVHTLPELYDGNDLKKVKEGFKNLNREP